MRGTVADSFKTSCFKNHTAVEVADNEDTHNQKVLFRVKYSPKEIWTGSIVLENITGVK